MSAAKGIEEFGVVNYFAGLGSWTLCSVGMLVFNKLAVRAFPLACTLVALQFLFTALAMVIPPWRKSIHVGSARDVLRWVVVVPFFTGRILTSVLALSQAPMTLVLTFRAVNPIFALMVERFYPKPLRVSGQMLLALLLSAVGVGVYICDMDRSSFGGTGWAVLNGALSVTDRLLQRMMLAKDQNPVDISKTGVTFLNNAIGMIPLLIAAFCTEEFPEVVPAFQDLGRVGFVWVVASCVVGTGLSYTNVWVQSLISATSFLVLVNANKFAILLLEAYAMQEKTIGRMQLLGASISILASMAYGQARDAVERTAEAEALLDKQDVPTDEGASNSDCSDSDNFLQVPP